MKTYRLRNFVKIFLLVFLLAALPVVQASAENGAGLWVDGDGRVTLPSQEAAAEGMTALSFSLFIDSPDAADVWFQFEGNSAGIQEFRYDGENKKLNIYIAGAETLVREDGELMKIGRIVIRDSSGSDKGAVATVRVAAGSLKYVCGTELKWMKDLETPDEMSMVSAGSESEPVDPTPEPTAPVETPTPEPTTPAETPTPEPTTPVETPTPEPTTPVETPTPEPTTPAETPTPEPTTPAGSATAEPAPTPTPTPTPGQTAGAATPTPSSAPGLTSQPTETPGSSPASESTSSADPAQSTEPSASPETSGSGDSGEDENSIPAVNDGTDNNDRNDGAAGQETNWVLIAAIIVIVLFVIVAIMAVVVLKRGSRQNKFEEDDSI